MGARAHPAGGCCYSECASAASGVRARNTPPHTGTLARAHAQPQPATYTPRPLARPAPSHQRSIWQASQSPRQWTAQPIGQWVRARPPLVAVFRRSTHQPLAECAHATRRRTPAHCARAHSQQPTRPAPPHPAPTTQTPAVGRSRVLKAVQGTRTHPAGLVQLYGSGVRAHAPTRRQAQAHARSRAQQAAAALLLCFLTHTTQAHTPSPQRTHTLERPQMLLRMALPPWRSTTTWGGGGRGW